MTKKFLLLFLILLPFNSIAQEKKTTFNEELFKKAQSDGKIVLVSSWIEYCYSCASQMKVLDKAKKEFEYIVTNYPTTEFASDAQFKIELIQDRLAGKEMFIGRHYLKSKKWIPAINRFKNVLENSKM